MCTEANDPVGILRGDQLGVFEALLEQLGDLFVMHLLNGRRVLHVSICFLQLLFSSD